MYYNLDDFGKNMLDIRISRSLTREKLSKLSLVSVETIRKIEIGKTKPSHMVLEDLSHILMIDLNKLLLDYRLGDLETFNNIKNSMESKFDRDEFCTLEKEHTEFKHLLQTTDNKYYKNLIKQLILLIESVIFSKKEKNSKKALDKLVQAMKISTPSFSLSNYKDYIYNSTEVRILMNISMLLKVIKSKEESLEMRKFCVDIADPTYTVYPKLLYNLAGGYHLIEDYKNALKYYNIGISSCNEKRNLNGLNLFYYGKGLAEYKLGCNEYTKSLDKAISLCDILDQDNLKKIIIDKCKEFHNIEL